MLNRVDEFRREVDHRIHHETSGGAAPVRNVEIGISDPFRAVIQEVEVDGPRPPAPSPEPPQAPLNPLQRPMQTSRGKPGFDGDDGVEELRLAPSSHRGGGVPSTAPEASGVRQPAHLTDRADARAFAISEIRTQPDEGDRQNIVSSSSSGSPEGGSAGG